jgi:MSHA biogenesis protein MshI
VSQQINLFNAAFVPKREPLTGKNLAIAVAVLCGVLVLIGAWSAQNARQKAAEAATVQAQLKEAQNAMEAVRVASSARKPSPALQAEIERSRQLFAMRNEVFEALNHGMGDDSGNAGFGDYLTGLSRQMREGLWITGFSVAAGGSGMVLRGRTLDKSLLPEYVRRLNSEPAFAGKSFAGLQVDYRENAVPATGRAVPPAPTFAGSSPAIAATPAPTKEAALTRFLEFQLLAENLPLAEKKP